MAKKPRPIRDRLIDAALDLAGERPWRTVTLGDIAAAARSDLATLHRHFPSRTAIVAAVMDRTSAAMLGEADAAASDEPPHDRLLDALMRRLDALRAHKAAVRSILRDAPADPIGLVCAAPAFLNAMAWTLEAAGIGSSGIAGRVRVKGLAAIYLCALRVWLGDDSADQGRTMAFIDQRLKRAERLAALLPGGIVGRAPRDAEEEPAA